MSVWKTLNRCSQIGLPVFASRQTTRSPSVTPSPAAVIRNNRSPRTSGDDRPPIGVFQMRLSFPGVPTSKRSGSPLAGDTPFWLGPLQCTQSAAEASPQKALSTQREKHSLRPDAMWSSSTHELDLFYVPQARAPSAET